MLDLLTRKIDLNYVVLDGSEANRKKAFEVEKMIAWVINDIRLRTFILDHKKQDGSLGFDQTKKTNYWHLEQFVMANERGMFKTDYTWDIKLKFYFKRFTRVIGFTNSNSVIINSNTKYNLGPVEMAANNIHEMCHVYGMSHSYSRSSLWPTTAPYAIGNYAAYLIKTYYSIEVLGKQPDVVSTDEPKITYQKPTFLGRVRMFFRRLFR